MDELVVLDLLLDCPVCLGKLDVTAKVLPCQHTFCQPCLQRLFKAKKELRCPECRTPVFCNIEDLPANTLLVRLLDGIRGGQSLVRKNSLQRGGGLFSRESFKRNRESKTNHEPHYRLFTKARTPIEGKPCAKALSNYRGRAPSDLTFNKGDIIVLHRQLDENWYVGEVNGDRGFFPASSVKVLDQMEKPTALCKALYNFELKDKDKARKKNCLKFVKDDIISVIRRVDENWAEGKLGDKVGIFPLLFVEPNHSAKQLLESTKSKGNNLTNIPSQLKRTPSKVKNSESATIRKTPEGRRKSPRQFLITNALNTFNRMVHSPIDRRTPEISTPILISSSNPTVIEKAEYLPNSPVQINASIYYATIGAQSTGPSLVAVPNSQQTILANMGVVLHSYTAHSPEELDLQKGEGVRVLGKFQEGWLRGVSLMTGKVGIFPSHCVNPVYRKSPNYPDPRVQSYPSNWISSNGSVSSQGSVSDNVLNKSVRSFYVPSAVADPQKKIPTTSSAMVPVSLRRRNSSIKKSSPPQKTIQSNPLPVSTTPNNRSPSAIVQPQQVFYNGLYSGLGPSAEAWSRQNPHCEISSFVGRVVDHRRHSNASSVFLETKDDSTSKPPTSAPPSILVKPDTPKNGSEKQVKTVRFMNFSPPALKRQSAQFLQDGKNEQGATINPKQELTSELEIVLSSPPRAGSNFVPPTEVRRVSRLRRFSNDFTQSTPSAVSSPSKRNSVDYTKRWSAIYHTQHVLSS
ncbi:E3 ubiquitin-protein ligase SH3RF2 isoform 2-T2 [Pelodytes ibericus]